MVARILSVLAEKAPKCSISGLGAGNVCKSQCTQVRTKKELYSNPQKDNQWKQPECIFSLLIGEPRAHKE
jgi:hypothetical protein